jgi:hypothetical protein
MMHACNALHCTLSLQIYRSAANATPMAIWQVLTGSVSALPLADKIAKDVPFVRNRGLQ